MNIRESLNEIDHRCIDSNSRFYDLRTMYESYSNKLSSDDKQKLKDLINKDTDAEVINAFLTSKIDPNLDENYEDDKYTSCEFRRVKTKPVKNADGYSTDYTWYKHPDYGNVFVLGDKDILCPEEADFDYQTESDEVAAEWFDNYPKVVVLSECGKTITIDESQRLTEKNLNRLVKGHDDRGYAIISGSRDTNTKEENDIKTKELKADIKKSGYSYVPVYGGYQEIGRDASTEKSFMVFPFDMNFKEHTDFETFQDFIIGLTDAYDQDSVLIKRPGENPRYWNRMKEVKNANGEIERVPERKWETWSFAKEPTLNDVTKEYFTALKSWKKDFNKGKPQRWTFEEYHLRPHPGTLSRNHQLHCQGELTYYGHLYESRTNYGNKGPWWYFSRHGFMPGSIPKDVHVERIIDTPNGSYGLLDGVLTTQELRYYDIQEKVPSKELLDEE